MSDRWKSVPVGECSRPCDGGEQRWQVDCVQETFSTSAISPSFTTTIPSATILEPLPAAVCRAAGLATPAAAVTPCNADPCPPRQHDSAATSGSDAQRVDGSAPAWIVPERSDFIQLIPMETVRLIVGGTARLFDGANVYVSCPTMTAGQSGQYPLRYVRSKLKYVIL